MAKIKKFFRKVKRARHIWKTLIHIIIIGVVIVASFNMGHYIGQLQLGMECLTEVENTKKECILRIGVTKGQCQVGWEILKNELKECKDGKIQ